MRCLVLLTLLVSSVGADDRNALRDETIKQVEQAYKSGDWQLVRSALWRARRIRERYGARDALPLAKAVAKGMSHDQSRIALEACATLSQMAIPGTTKLLVPMLAPPREVTVGRHKVYLACIKTAADLHELDGIRPLEKLLGHPDKFFAVAAARALARFWVIDDRPLLSLVHRLAGQLEGFLKKIEVARSQEDRAAEKHCRAVADALVAALQKLSDDDKLKTPDDFRKWVRKRRKALKMS